MSMAETSTSALGPPAVRTDYFLIPRMLVSAVLLTAAVLKIHELSTGPVVGTGLFAHRGMHAFEAEFEIAMAFWLISGWARRLAWLAALACFIVFCGVTTWEHFSGFASCGCFGKVSVAPRFTLILDVTIVVMLLLLRPRADRPFFDLRMTRPAAAVLLAGLAAMVGGAMPVLGYTPSETDGTVLLEPEDWVGRALPIARHIDIADEIGRGEWTVLLYHDTCQGCKALIPKLADRVRAMPPGQCAKIALIEIPPYGESLRELAGKDALFVMGRLDESREWLAATPVVLQLRDGKVASALVAQGEAARAKAAAGPIATTQAAEKELDLGEVAPASVHGAWFRLANPTPAAVGLAATSGTPNVTVKDCPERIPPRSFALVEAEFVAPAKPGDYVELIGIRAEGPGGANVSNSHLTIRARVER